MLQIFSNSYRSQETVVVSNNRNTKYSSEMSSNQSEIFYKNVIKFKNIVVQLFIKNCLLKATII